MSYSGGYRTLFPSSARTATPAAVNFEDNTQRRQGGHFIVDVTAIGPAPTITVTIEAFDIASGKWYALLTSAAITAVGTTVLKIYPGVTPAANAAASDILPPTWRMRVTHGNSDSITYSIGARLFD
jgi:hypothetical protein